MNHRLQLSPISGIRESQVDIPSRGTRENSQSQWQDTKLFRSWIVYDSECKPVRGGVNWNVVLGLGAAVIFSVGFWIAMGVLFARWWR
jgi:hypothetical protein